MRELAEAEGCGLLHEGSGFYTNSAVTSEPSQLLVFNRDMFDRIIAPLSNRTRLVEATAFLKEMPYFARWRRVHLPVVADAMRLREFKRNQTIAVQSGPLDHVRFVISGEIGLKQRPDPAHPPLEVVRCGRFAILGMPTFNPNLFSYELNQPFELSKNIGEIELAQQDHAVLAKTNKLHLQCLVRLEAGEVGTRH